MTRPIQGLFPALATAFDAQGNLDANLQKELVNRLLAQGADGFFVCGTTGEFPVLSLDEREHLLEIVVAEVTGQVPIAVHAGTPRVEDAVRLAQHAARIGAQAISTVPPYYYAHRVSATLDYLDEIATATDLPFYYYHIPECTGQTIDTRFLEKLLTLPNFAGLKFSDTNFSLFQELKDFAGPDCQFVCGVDTMFLSSLLLGAEGAVGSTFNLLLPLFRKLWKAHRSDDINAAHEHQLRANHVINLLNRHPHIAAVKESLRLLDLDIGEPRRPLSRLSPQEKSRFAEALTKINVWEIDGILPTIQNRS